MTKDYDLFPVACLLAIEKVLIGMMSIKSAKLSRRTYIMRLSLALRFQGINRWLQHLKQGIKINNDVAAIDPSLLYLRKQLSVRNAWRNTSISS